MVRTNKTRKCVASIAKRSTAKRRRGSFKTSKAINITQKNRKSLRCASNANQSVKKLRKSITVSPLNRMSRRLVMKQQQATDTMTAKKISLNNTIVIDDSDDENETNSSNIQQNEATLFYEDRSPGLRELEVPLYQIEDKLIINDDVLDSTIIVLDNTMENSLNSEHAHHGEAHSNSEQQPIINPQENDTTIIDLRDDTDDESLVSSSTANIIPLGYNIAKPMAITTQTLTKNKDKNVVATKGNNTAKGPPPKIIDENMQKKRMIVIDGNNVSYGHLNGKMFSVKGLELCINYFKKLGHEVVAVVPQYKLKKSQTTDQALLEKLHREGYVILAPSKSIPGYYSSTYDDRLILSVAEKFDGVIVSNDNFRDLLDSNPTWQRIIKTRVIGYTWVKDCFFLPDDPYGRQGPSLQAILNGESS